MTVKETMHPAGNKEKLLYLNHDTEVKSRNNDQGWALVVLCANFFANTVSSALFYTFGMYHSVLLEQFGASRSITAWVGSTNNSIFMLTGPLATMVLDKYGNRATIMLAGLVGCIGYVLSSLAPNLIALFFTYGLIAAFGSCLNYTGWVIALGTYFPTKYALAFSIGQTGVGVGIFALGPLFKSLIINYGWRGAFLINGAIALHFSVFGALLFPPREARASEKKHPAKADSEACKELLKPKTDVIDSSSLMTTHSMLRDSRAWFLNISCFFWLTATMIIFVLMHDFALSQSLGDYYMHTFTSMGVGDLIGRLVIGLAIQHFHLNAIVVSTVAQFACTWAILSFLFIFNGLQMAAQGCFFSFTYGIQCVCLALVPNLIFGQQNLSIVFGFNMFFCGAGTLAGPPLAGLIVDLTGSFVGALTFAAACEFASAAAMLSCYVCYRKQINSKKKLFPDTS